MDIHQKIAEAVDAEAILGELAYRDLAEFVRQGWSVIEPGTPLTWNWHLDIICEALQRQIVGDPNYRKLVICVPPGTMKSLLAGVFAPTWEWLRAPHRRKLCLSNDIELSSRDSRRSRDLIQSEWYQKLIWIAHFGHGVKTWTLAEDQNVKTYFTNTHKGFRQSRSIYSKITGKRADDVIIDDPLDAKEMIYGSVEQVTKRLHRVNSVIEQVLPSRVNSLASARWTLIMQRLHQDDPAGVAIAGGWRIINLQMEYDPANPLNHPNDPRTEQGELLFPQLFPRHELDVLRKGLGTQYYGQYQQDPRPGERAIFKRWYWCYWYPKDVRPIPRPVEERLPDGTIHTCQQGAIPRVLEDITQSWDMAFKDTKDSAYVVGQVWGAHGANAYLLDQVRDKMDFVTTLDAVRGLTRRWPQAITKLIEDKANGTAVMNMLRSKIAGIHAVNPDGGKEARMNSAAPAVRSGNVWLPHPDLFPWVKGFVDECEGAPHSSYMDQVDAYTQYINYRYGSGSALVEALLSGGG